MKRLVMMIGLPASGKSAIARKIFNDAYVVSTDAIRGEPFGDENIQGDPNKVFDIAKTRMAIHDCGKLFTASFKNHKGEITEECHYYQHHCVGAYDSVFHTRNICGQESGGYESAAYIANPIFYHMHPLLNWKNNEKKMKKDTEKMNAGFVKDLMLLHKADVQAH